jgi:hypothetical protein
MEQKLPIESEKNKKFPNKAILPDNVDEASSFVLDDNTSTRLAVGQLSKAEKRNEAILNTTSIAGQNDFLK